MCCCQKTENKALVNSCVSLKAAVWVVVVRFTPEASSVPVTSAACNTTSAAKTSREPAPQVRQITVQFTDSSELGCICKK